MATTTTTGSITLSAALTKELIDNVKGHSALARLTAQDPISFTGSDNFLFSLDGEAAIVGESGNKPAGSAAWNTVTIKPVKFIYQHRVTSEFTYLSEELQVPYLSAFIAGFGKKMARALDIAAFKGIDPATKATSTIVGTNNFDSKITNTAAYSSSTPDSNVDTAVALVRANDAEVNGIVMTPAFGSALGQRATTTGTFLYPQFRFGGTPDKFESLNCDVNSTLAYNASTTSGDTNTVAIVGDFENMFKWGYAMDMDVKVIPYGSPDGGTDLQYCNQVCLRAEAYIGWGILDANAFARVVQTVA